ncbi:ATPase family associated with various cellular activities (AAA) [Anaerotignum neopropionicum]|uniref:ATPase family associated with various cellular activities (AAA) n=1 Tax=Anaerotignum neopropionicum TaxID=36847 RepID=A0A136WI85_9FIRM|nr:AAA family ATPase [Anaerotignum neopropionicum]KXL54255.1 ATPase family associated with various cellular activities (AAA) [Anaerotignum neopropionicum]KXL54380.1 ATPase family associated with various cellular activities (AAA) [Anaerotignum neopropionicum]
MNIKQAKEEIQRAIQAYLLKNEFGEYVIPRVRQRPVLLMGPPGIGKTAIMEQVARECGVALVSYSITHHTRQSAIGLPFISHKEYGGKEYAVTEYTMSEIIASVYNKMEETGLSEGILFIDEINCASETLAPAMLQFLQAKTFGAHSVPQGWLIVAAGNPPEFNKSVREFDVVTLDRVKKIDVEPDFQVWKEYAYKQSIHGAILSYLEIKKNYFYAMETTVDGKRFVTPRGWEDLSTILKVYETMGIEVDAGMLVQYLQHPKMARDFANYLDLYNKYKTDYHLEDILKGAFTGQAVSKLSSAAFDEKLSVLGLLLSRLSDDFKLAYEGDLFTTELHQALLELKERFQSPYCEETPWDQLMEGLLEEKENTFIQEQKAALLDQNIKKSRRMTIERLIAMEKEIKGLGLREKDAVFEEIKASFAKDVALREMLIETGERELENTFLFLEEAFGAGQEMVIFITELTTNFYSVKFISENGSEKYYQYNKELLFDEKQKSILKDIESAKAEGTLLF